MSTMANEALGRYSEGRGSNHIEIRLMLGFKGFEAKKVLKDPLEPMKQKKKNYVLQDDSKRSKPNACDKALYSKLQIHVFHQDYLTGRSDRYWTKEQVVELWERTMKHDPQFVTADRMEIILQHHFGNFSVLEDNQDDGRNDLDRAIAKSFLSDIAKLSLLIKPPRVEEFSVRSYFACPAAMESLYLLKNLSDGGLKVNSLSTFSTMRPQMESINLSICNKLRKLDLNNAIVNADDLTAVLLTNKKVLKEISLRFVVLLKDDESVPWLEDDCAISKIFHYISFQQNTRINFESIYTENSPLQAQFSERNDEWFNEMSNFKVQSKNNFNEQLNVSNLTDHLELIDELFENNINKTQAIWFTVRHKCIDLIKSMINKL